MKIIKVMEEDGCCDLLDRTGSLWWCRITGEECDGCYGGDVPSSCRIIDIPDECEECFMDMGIIRNEEERT